jgi:hypothetical protein
MTHGAHPHRSVARPGEIDRSPVETDEFKVVAMAVSSKGMFRINLGLVLAELICIPAFIFELERAISGNTLSWAYVFEWPLLGGYAVYMWHRLRQDERGEGPRHRVVFDEADPELDAWNAYLASMHQRDPADPPERDR